jgi:ABC-type uncharacterized transport system substrate-binding protein
MPLGPLQRRRFVALLGGAAAWPLAARAQQPASVRRIGVLILGSESDPNSTARVTAMHEGLQKQGWFDGRNLHVDLRFAANPGSIRAFADELVNLAPDVILVHSSTATSMVRQRTKTIPLVFVAVGDPLANGIVESIARPQGNITGFTNLVPTIGGKWLELLKQAAPRLARAGLLFNPDLFFSQTYFASIEATGSKLGIQVIRKPYRNSSELVAAVDTMAAEPDGGLIVLPPIGEYPAQLISRVEQNRLPTISNVRSFPAAGGLMSYGADTNDLFRRASSYVDRILRGEKPGDLAVQFPTKFEMVLNLGAAKALGLTIPWALSAVADEVIE